MNAKRIEIVACEGGVTLRAFDEQENVIHETNFGDYTPDHGNSIAHIQDFVKWAFIQEEPMPPGTPICATRPPGYYDDDEGANASRRDSAEAGM